MSINSNVRNVLVIIVLAAIVDGVAAGRTAANVVIQAVSLAFLATLVWIATRLYREHRLTLESLGTRRRTILYVAAGVVALTLTATDRLWNNGLGILWVFLLVGSGYALYGLYRSYKQY